jgi:hypothetical protein
MKGEVRALAFDWLGDSIAEPVSVESVDESLVEEAVPTDVIPMDVGGHHQNRDINDGANDAGDVGYPGARIDQRRTLLTHEEIRVHVLPVAVFG